MSSSSELDIETAMITKMVYEDNRLKTFTDGGRWPFSKDCNCTPQKMASAGFYWCGSETQPDLVRCFVCLKEFEDWEPNDNPRDEHKRLCPQCPFMKLGKLQENCTVKEVTELCQKSLIKLIEKRAGLLVEQYAAQAADVRRTLEQLGKQNNIELCDKL